MRSVVWIAGTLLAASFVLMGSGCRGGNKAGGASATHTVALTFASQIRGGQLDQLVDYANQVSSLSGGTMRIDFKPNWRAGQPNQEIGTIRDVRSGKVHLG